MSERKKETLIIIGSGPAAWTAAIYGARAQLDPFVIEGSFHRTMVPGGQLMFTTEVENYPGFPDGITGQAMMEGFKKQAQRFGTRSVMEEVERVDFSDHPHILWTSGDEEYEADAVIVATPDWMHAEHSIACLEAGLHVYCEKEMSNDLEKAKQMVIAAKKSGKGRKK